MITADGNDSSPKQTSSHAVEPGSDYAITLTHIAADYDQCVTDHGVTARGVGWSTEAAQQVRFQTLLRILDSDPQDRPVTVHDLGCGWGALWQTLKTWQHPPIARYRGWDISTAMLQEARRRFAGSTRAEFKRGAMPETVADYAFASGTFNYRSEMDSESWNLCLRETIRHLARTCRRGLAFNLLHIRTPRHLAAMHYADPKEWLCFAQDLANERKGRAAVAEDYLPDDFTVYLRFSA